MEELLYVPTKKYVSFDSSGMILSISNSKPDTDNFIIVEQKDIEHLLSGAESTLAYEISFDIIEKKYKLARKSDDSQATYNINNDFYEISLNEKEFDVCVMQDNTANEWVFVVNEVLSKKLLEKSLYNETKIFFSITEHKDPFLLKQFVMFDLYTLLLNGQIRESFNKNIAKNKKYSIFTKKLFDKYSYEVVSD